jgi:hypothetical protein
MSQPKNPDKYFPAPDLDVIFGCLLSDMTYSSGAAAKANRQKQKIKKGALQQCPFYIYDV